MENDAPPACGVEVVKSPLSAHAPGHNAMPNATQPHVGIIATSLSSDSRSQLLAREALSKLQAQKVRATLVDLREHALPFTGSDASWGDPAVGKMKTLALTMTHLLFAVPIYNYDVNALAKNFVELMGSDVLENKTVAFLCSAGGQDSFMSVMAFANSLMLDFRCWIAPRFLYVTDDFSPGALPKKLDERLDSLLRDLLTRGLQQ